MIAIVWDLFVIARKSGGAQRERRHHCFPDLLLDVHHVQTRLQRFGLLSRCCTWISLDVPTVQFCCLSSTFAASLESFSPSVCRNGPFRWPSQDKARTRLFHEGARATWQPRCLPQCADDCATCANGHAASFAT